MKGAAFYFVLCELFLLVRARGATFSFYFLFEAGGFAEDPTLTLSPANVRRCDKESVDLRLQDPSAVPCALSQGEPTEVTVVLPIVCLSGLSSKEKSGRGRTILQSRDQACGLSGSLVRRFYDASERKWELNAELLDEIEGDVQRLVACVADSETISVAGELVLRSTRTVTIDRPIRIAGEAHGGDDPRWTCSSTQGGEQIFIIE